MNDDPAFRSAQARYDNMEPPPDPEPDPLCSDCHKRPHAEDSDYCNECAQAMLARVIPAFMRATSDLDKVRSALGIARVEEIGARNILLQEAGTLLKASMADPEVMPDWFERRQNWLIAFEAARKRS